MAYQRSSKPPLTHSYLPPSLHHRLHNTLHPVTLVGWVWDIWPFQDNCSQWNAKSSLPVNYHTQVPSEVLAAVICDAPTHSPNNHHSSPKYTPNIHEHSKPKWHQLTVSQASTQLFGGGCRANQDSASRSWCRTNWFDQIEIPQGRLAARHPWNSRVLSHEGRSQVGRFLAKVKCLIGGRRWYGQLRRTVTK